MKLKQFDFQKNGHTYSFKYDHVKGVIDHLVSIADTDKSNLSLFDVWHMMRPLARIDRAGK